MTSICPEWNEPIVFTVYGQLRGKSRPRFNYKTHRAYTPETTKDYEEAVFQAYARTCKEKTKKPVKIEIYAFKKIPKARTKKEVTLIKAGKLFPTQKPDVDNISKIVLDALNKAAYEDDVQIIDQRIAKRYTEGKERITVMIYTLKD